MQTIWHWSNGTWWVGFQFTSICRHISHTTVDMKHCPRSVHHNLLKNARKLICWPPFMQMLRRRHRHTTMSIMFKKNWEIFSRMFTWEIFSKVISTTIHATIRPQARHSHRSSFLSFFLWNKQAIKQKKPSGKPNASSLPKMYNKPA